MSNDKRHHRMVTLVSLAFGLLVYVAARFGLFGDSAMQFSKGILAIILLILGVRAVLTEMGIRRRRFSWEKKFASNERGKG
jgi:tetrahydromethanopterin S-methyltransferase subunit E